MSKLAINHAPATIQFNNEEIKEEIKATLAEYKGAIFTDDTIKSAKPILADLRGKQKALNARRIEIGKIYNQPFDEFKKKVDELIELYNEPIKEIDSQVKDYEERKKEEKRQLINTIYAEYVDSELSEYIPLAKIYNSKWENAGTTKKAITEEIKEVAATTMQSVTAIREMKSDIEEEVIAKFKNDLSLSNAIANIQRHEQQKAEILRREKERQEAEEKARQEAEIRRMKEEALAQARAEIEAEEKKKAEIAKSVEVEVEKAKEEVVEMFTPQETIGEIPFEYTLKIMLTESQKETLEMYMNSIGLDFIYD